MMKPIILINPYNGMPLQETTAGLDDGHGQIFPLQDGVYRIVQHDHYTDNFSYQWKKFRTTQIDKATGLSLSRDRFFAETGWDKEDLSGKNILEVGSGAGRFTQIILDHTRANLYSVDYSEAVFSNYKNNGPNERLKLFQASLYEMPFAPGQFDKVFCFGVLQHTPDVEKSVQKLIAMLKPGGELVVDFYPITGWWTKLHAKYFLRPITRKMDNQQLYNKIDRHADTLIRTYRFFSGIGLGRIANRFIPVCDIDGTLPKNLAPDKLREMVVLDTFDMFSPEYDQPKKIPEVVNWFNRYGMEKVWGGFIHYHNYRAAVVKGLKK